MIPDAFLQELLHRVDIVDLIDGYVPLKKAGADFAACCPFHSEKSPSFTVSPGKQFYHCFGCGAHGTAIGFVMAYSGVGFVEAVKDLAARAGMSIPEFQEQPGSSNGPSVQALTETMSRAATFYYEQLKGSEKAISYLKGRGVSGEIARRFRLGYAPANGQSLAGAFADYSRAELQVAGLVIKNDAGRLYDRFRDRLMFPIVAQKGDIIAFGGRVIGQGEPKYLNSPETPLFEKGREVFGLPQARAAIREHNTVIVVEGYMDVVALAQHGIRNVVATLGTATTPTHVQKLLRQADRIVYGFDGDLAGRKAAWRALENSVDALPEKKSIAFAFLPQGEDPDSFVRQRGAEAFRRLIAQAMPLSEFLLRELAARGDLTTAEGKARLVAEAKPFLGRLQSPLLRLQLVKRLAELSAFSQPEVEALCALPSLVRAAPARVPRQAPSLLRRVLCLLLQRPQLVTRLPLDLLPEHLAEARAIHQWCTLVTACGDPAPPYPVLLEKLRDSEHEEILHAAAAELMRQPFDEEGIDTEFDGAVTRLAEGHRKRSFALLQHRIQKLGVGGLSSEEKKLYLQALGAQARAASESQL